MIKERVIEQAEDGSSYAVNAVTMIYEDMDGHHLTFYISPDGLYNEVHAGVVKMSQTDTGDLSTLSPEIAHLKVMLTKTIKATVKGVFMMYGDKIMTLLYGSPNHPRPPKEKKLDLVNWYLEEFTKVLIAHLMKNDIVLIGQRTEVSGDVISIDSVYTRPVPAPQGTGDTGGDSGTSGQSHS